MARESAQTVVVLSNAGATGNGVAWGGGKALATILVGTGGATVALQALGPDGTTYVTVPSGSVATNTCLSVELPAGTYRGLVTGGTAPAGIYIEMKGVL